MMKANNQLGFININEDSIDKIIKDDEVIFERGFLREKTSTTLPITFGGIGKDLKDYKIYGNTYQKTISGKNLLDDKNITARTHCTVDNGVITTTPLARASLVYVNINDIPLKVGDELYTTFKVRLKSGTATKLGYGGRLYDGTTYATNTGITSAEVSDDFVIYSIKQTVSTDIIAKQMVFQAANVAGVSDAVYEIKDIIVSTNPIDTYEEYTGGQPSPNPDYPQEIVSCGDRTKNLFDGEYEVGGYDVNTGEKNINTTLYRNKEPIKVLPNTNYIFSINGVGQAVNVLEYKADGTYIGRIGSGAVSSNSYFTTSSETGYINIFRGASAGIEKWQIEQNDTITSYEPYGYKIPVNVRSDNLYNKNDELTNKYINDTGSEIPGASGDLFIKTIIDNNIAQKYTVNFSNRVGTGYIRISFFNGNTFISRILITESNQIINVPTNATKIDIRTDETTTKYFENLQIVEGSTAPSKYIPYYNETTNIYLNEPLRKKDGYSDYIDFKNGKVVRQLGEVVFDGSESWVLADIYNNISQFDYTNNLIKNFSQYANISLFANYFGTTARWNNSWLKDNIALHRVNSNKIRIQSSNFTTLEDFKTWLSTHNTTVDYVLATPTEESITLPNIPTLDGNNTLNIETEITPSQVYIKYKSNN